MQASSTRSSRSLPVWNRHAPETFAVTASTYGNGLFDGPGETRALARSIDWARTPLGPVEQWSSALRTTVRACLESPFPINLWCGPELVLIYNDAYRRVLGAKHPGALGRRGSEVWAEIWDEIRPMFEQIRVGGRAAYADDAPFVVRRAGESDGASNPDEPNAWFTFSLSAVRDEEGEIVAFLNIVAETTDRIRAERGSEAARARAERAEARLTEVFAQAPAFLAVLRGEGHVFEYVNAAYYQVVGHRELLGRPVREALPEVRNQGFELLLDRVLESGEPYVGREVSVLLSRSPGAEPEERFVDFVYYPITEADGSRSGVVAHGADVTDHVLARRAAQQARAEAERAQRQAEAARAEAEAANQAKSQFLANMSHEIRTPINAIVGYTDLLEMELAGPVNEAQREQLERVRLSGQHLLGLIEDVLDLAKAEAGRIEVAHERASAAQAVRAALSLIGPQAAQQGLTVRSRCADEVGSHYLGDEDRVRQILVNLLSNAVKFTPPGGSIRIDCGASPEADVGEGGPFVFIRVQDTGIGIAPEQLDSVFEPFVQAETGHTRTRGGTGLGLTISRRLARLMGGDLTASSEAGAGSTFTLWLPSDGDRLPLAEAMLEEAREQHPQGLVPVGEALRDSIEEVLEALVARLRDDRLIPKAAFLRQGDLEDHAATFLADIAQALIALEETEVNAIELLRDGSEIQQLIAKLHGAQRARLGWTEEAFRREFAILREEIETSLRRRLPPGEDVEGAVGMLMRLLRHAERVSLRGWRSSAARSASIDRPPGE